MNIFVEVSFLVVDNMSRVRLFLLGCGFVQDTNTVQVEYGMYYRYYIPDSQTLFSVYIDRCVAEARYPDAVYNKSNPYATKDCVTSMNWNKGEDSDVIIANLKNFFHTTINIVQKGYV